MAQSLKQENSAAASSSDAPVDIMHVVRERQLSLHAVGLAAELGMTGCLQSLTADGSSSSGAASGCSSSALPAPQGAALPAPGHASSAVGLDCPERPSPPMPAALPSLGTVPTPTLRSFADVQTLSGAATAVAAATGTCSLLRSTLHSLATGAAPPPVRAVAQAAPEQQQQSFEAQAPATVAQQQQHQQQQQQSERITPAVLAGGPMGERCGHCVEDSDVFCTWVKRQALRNPEVPQTKKDYTYHRSRTQAGGDPEK